jgi:hypothetical protein
MNAWVVVSVIAVLATLVLFAVLRQLARLEQRVEELEAVAHPPVDVRTVAKAYARSEVKRVLAEHVP